MVSLSVETEPQPRVGPSVVLTGPHVVDHTANSEADLSRGSGASTRIIQKGRAKSSGDGCDFRGDATTRGQVRVVTTELAYDPVRCLMLTEIAVFPTADDLWVGRNGGSADTDEGLAAANAPKAGTSKRSTGLATRNYQASTLTRVVEPAYPALPALNTVTAIVKVYGGEPRYYPTNALIRDSWYTTSGWYRTEFTPYFDFNYSYARATGYAKYRNDVAGRVLCGILWGSTYAQHYPTQVRGYRDGHGEHSWNTSKSGNCSFLLRTQHEIANVLI